MQDKGFLTTLRTAIAGIICLTIIPWMPQNIGIIGSGSLVGQLHELARAKYPKANVILYARNTLKAAAIGVFGVRLCRRVGRKMRYSFDHHFFSGPRNVILTDKMPGRYDRNSTFP